MSTKLSTIFPPAMAEGETPKDWSRRLVNALNEFALDVDFLTSGILRYGESPTTEGVYAGPGGVGYWSEGTSAWTVIIGADGSMQIVGATGNSLTFDGTNLSVEGSITAEAGAIAGWTISSTQLASPGGNIVLDSNAQTIRVGPGAGPYVLIDGANTEVESSNYASGSAGSGFSLGPNLLEVGNIACRGLIRTAVFQKGIITATAGSIIITPNDDVLATDMTALDSCTMTIKGTTTFSVGNMLRIKDENNDEWFEVTSAASAPTYTVTRDKAAAYAADSNPTWKKGATVVNYGSSGAGGIFMTASESNAPYISVFTHAGAPWTTTTTKARFGNLNGYAGYSSDEYGIAAYIDANTFFKIDATNGIQLGGTSLSINSSTFGSSGIQLQYNSGNPRFYCGDGTAYQYLQFTTEVLTSQNPSADYSETDPGGDITRSTTSVTVSTMTNDVAAYVYDDFGAGYFSGNFQVNFRINVSAQSNTADCIICAFSNTVGNFQAVKTASGNLVGVKAYTSSGGTHYLALVRIASGTEVLCNENTSISLSTTYYCTLIRDEDIGDFGALRLYIYSDSSRTVMVDRTELMLSSQVNFRYFYIVQSDDWNDAGVSTSCVASYFALATTLSGLSFRTKHTAGIHIGGGGGLYLDDGSDITLDGDPNNPARIEFVSSYGSFYTYADIGYDAARFTICECSTTDSLILMSGGSLDADFETSATIYGGYCSYQIGTEAHYWSTANYGISFREETYPNFRPNSNNVVDCGNDSYAWKDLYFYVSHDKCTFLDDLDDLAILKAMGPLTNNGSPVLDKDGLPKLDLLSLPDWMTNIDGFLLSYNRERAAAEVPLPPLTRDELKEKIRNHEFAQEDDLQFRLFRKPGHMVDIIAGGIRQLDRIVSGLDSRIAQLERLDQIIIGLTDRIDKLEQRVDALAA